MTAVCILHGPRADADVVARTIKALAERQVDCWEADRDGPVAAVTPRLKDTTLVVTLGFGVGGALWDR